VEPNRVVAVEGRAGEVEGAAGAFVGSHGQHRLGHVDVGAVGQRALGGDQGGDLARGFRLQQRDGRPDHLGPNTAMSPCRLSTMSCRPVRIEHLQRRQHPVGARRQSGGRSARARTAALDPLNDLGVAAATATGPTPAASACLNTRTIMGAPADESASGLPGRRLAASRAGM
jgi:hypothetical protein